MKKIFINRSGLIITGVVGALAAVILQLNGNPANMGLCMACFIRDTAGALGLHSAGIVQYIRPEVIGLVVGALIVALLRNEFKPRSSSNAIIRLVLGFFAMIGALVFLGCPWRAFIRIAGGDWNAILGIAGLIAGIWIGSLFVKKGYSLGTPNKSENKISGYVMPVIFISLLAMLVLNFTSLKSSVSGPGSMRAPIILSFGLALLVGGLIQVSRFCTVGAIRNLFITRNTDMFIGLIAFIATLFTANLILGSFNGGFDGQPIAHTDGAANFLGMALSGLCFVLAGGCPGRQLVMIGEGSSDASIFIVGMLLGGAVAHNFSLASSGAGATTAGVITTVIGILFCIVVALVFTKRYKA